MEKPKMPGTSVVVQETLSSDRFPSDEVIKADNEGRLQQYIAAHLRKVFKSKFVGRHNTEDLQHEMQTFIRHTVRQLEAMGIINPDEHIVDVRPDSWVDCMARGDLGPPDPTLVHVSVRNKKMLVGLGPDGIPWDKVK